MLINQINTYLTIRHFMKLKIEILPKYVINKIEKVLFLIEYLKEIISQLFQKDWKNRKGKQMNNYKIIDIVDNKEKINEH